MSRSPCSHRTHRGQALVEFALLLPVLVLLTLGTLDLGVGVFTNNMLSNAAREGARVGIVPTNTRSQMCTRIINTIQASGVASSSGCSSIGDSSAMAFGTLTMTIHRGTTASSSDPDSVTLSYSFTPVTGLVGVSPIALKAESSMYVEQ